MLDVQQRIRDAGGNTVRSRTKYFRISGTIETSDHWQARRHVRCVPSRGRCSGRILRRKKYRRFVANPATGPRHRWQGLLRLGTVLSSHSSGLLIHRLGYPHMCFGPNVEMKSGEVKIGVRVMRQQVKQVGRTRVVLILRKNYRAKNSAKELCGRLVGDVTAQRLVTKTTSPLDTQAENQAMVVAGASLALCPGGQPWTSVKADGSQGYAFLSLDLQIKAWHVPSHSKDVNIFSI